MPTICLPSEVYEREFDAKLLLAAKLASEYRHNVVIGCDKIFNYFLPHSEDVLLMDKAASSIIYEGRISHVVRRGGCSVVSDEEGFNNLGIRGKNTFLSRISPRALKDISLYACWGQKDYQFYQEVPGFDRVAEIIGNCRSDLLGEIGKKYYDDLSKSLNEVYGPYVFVSDSFAVEKLGMKGLPRYDISNDKQKEVNKEYADWLETATRLRSYFVENIKHAASSLPHIQFVLRPHPAAHPRWWHEQLCEFRNVHIIFRHAPAWIHGAMAVMTMGCTLGTQAILAGKPTLEIVSSELPVYGEAPQLLENHISSPNELVYALLAIANRSYTQSIKHEKLKYIWANTNSSSVSLFAKKLDQLSPSSRQNIVSDISHMPDLLVLVLINGLTRFHSILFPGDFKTL